LTRRHFTIACEGYELAATLDAASGSSGLLIVSGGNELRAGAWNGQALLAARLAARGIPVLRFDRRGVGDATGKNQGFQGSGADITAALAAFRAAVPQLKRVVGFGNCDAASALMLGAGCGCDALVLANPWTLGEGESAPPAPAALKAHYARRLTSPAALLRLVSGQVSPRKLLKSLSDIARPPQRTALANEIATGLTRFGGPVKILLAERDRTAHAFLGAWDKADPRLRHCPAASHSFVEPSAQEWLEEQLFAALISELG
jgi:exosortase A-associated hydrolase 1